MAIVATQLVTNQTAVAGTSTATASFTPTNGKLVLAMVGHAGTTPSQPTASGNNLTWTAVTSYQDTTNQRRITVFRAYALAASTGALTFNWGANSQNNMCWSITEFSGCDVSGTNAANAIVQFVSGEVTGTNTGQTLTLGAFSNTANGTYGTIRTNNIVTAVVGAGFTELGQTNATGQTGEAEFKNSNDTTVDWTWASTALVSIGIAIELKASKGGGFFLFM